MLSHDCPVSHSSGVVVFESDRKPWADQTLRLKGPKSTRSSICGLAEAAAACKFMGSWGKARHSLSHSFCFYQK